MDTSEFLNKEIKLTKGKDLLISNLEILKILSYSFYINNKNGNIYIVLFVEKDLNPHLQNSNIDESNENYFGEKNKNKVDEQTNNVNANSNLKKFKVKIILSIDELAFVSNTYDLEQFLRLMFSIKKELTMDYLDVLNIMEEIDKLIINDCFINLSNNFYLGLHLKFIFKCEFDRKNYKDSDKSSNTSKICMSTDVIDYNISTSSIAYNCDEKSYLFLEEDNVLVSNEITFDMSLIT